MIRNVFAAISLAALLAACGGNNMDQPAIIYDDGSKSPTLSASSTASGYDVNDILTATEIAGWKPAGVAPAWSDAEVTDLPTASRKGSAVMYGSVVYTLWSGGKTYRLDLSSPAGAWDDAGVTDAPGDIYGGNLAFVYAGKLYAVCKVADWDYRLYSLDLATPAGSWVQVADVSRGDYVQWAVNVGDSVYIAYTDGTIGRIQLLSPGSGLATYADVSGYYTEDAVVIGNYIYAYRWDVPSIVRIDMSSLTTWQWQTVASVLDNSGSSNGTRLVAHNDVLYLSHCDHFAQLNTNAIDQGIDTSHWTPATMDERQAPAVVYSGYLYYFGGVDLSATVQATTKRINVVGEYVTLDFGYDITPDSLALLADGVDIVGITLYASSDNFTTSVYAGSGVMINSALYVPVTVSGSYRWWRVYVSGYGSQFVLKYLQLTNQAKLPYMADGADLDRFGSDGKQLVSGAGYYLGAVVASVMRSVDLNFGQVNSAELQLFRSWANVCVAAMQPFFFVPDTAESRAWFGWVDPGYDFSAPCSNGLYDVASIPFKGRVA